MWRQFLSSVILPHENTVFPFIFTVNNGLVACCTSIRYLSINSVKRGVVPDRNVLLKGICWTMPSMPWWVWKICWSVAKKQEGGGWKRGIEWEKFLEGDCRFSSLLHLRGKENKTMRREIRLTDLWGNRLLENWSKSEEREQRNELKYG